MSSSSPRIEELRRRVQKDPASIAFAQLAEECRRTGEYDEAVRVAREGLVHHPGYLSARVTLGRALLELGQLEAGESELETVLKTAPENLAAIRALADIHQRRGDAPIAAEAIAPRVPDEEASPVARTFTVREEASHEGSPHGSMESLAADEIVADDHSKDVAEPPAIDVELQDFNRALESLDALTLDVPESAAATPSSSDFDLGSLYMNAPSRPEAEPADWSLASLDNRSAGDPPAPATRDLALETLEQWLGAIRADREERRQTRS